MIPVLRSASVSFMRILGALLAAFWLSGCGTTDGASGEQSVVAAFYPLAWAAERVGGDSVEVTNLTQAGAEPHDVELSPRDVEAIRDAELVVYAGSGFQPAVEDAVADRDGPSLDVVEGDRDPHVWLDPVRFAAIAEEIGRVLDDPESATELADELRTIDREYRIGLESCERRTLVTTHAAFGHLAARYRLMQLSLTGKTPEAEPGPRDLERLIEQVEDSGATTVFAEPLVSDRLAATVAREAGVEVAVLDPVEGLSEERLDAGEDYLSVMRDNLTALREALECR
jgi:zinc transport system substrate-binding protein